MAEQETLEGRDVETGCYSMLAQTTKFVSCILILTSTSTRLLRRATTLAPRIFSTSSVLAAAATRP